MGEREIAALLRQVEGDEGFEFTEGSREEIIDPGFDEVPETWEVLGLPVASFRPGPWPSAVLDDGEETAW